MTLNTRWTHRIALALLIALLAAVPLGIVAQHTELPTAAPGSVGFSVERLKAVDAALHKLVDEGALSGIVTLIARKGKIVSTDAYGYQDLGKKIPMRQDSIFRIYSMTKPITGVAMMKLYEQGKWHPDDPLSRYIPEFANLQVYAGEGSGGVRLEKPAHPPTVGELMTHTAGFTYGFFGATAVDKQYQADNPLAAPTLQAFIEKLSKIPLLYQPGSQWVYSVAVDVQGHLVEKLSGKSLPEYMRQEIFDPLGMRDTGFSVPEAKLARLATVYNFDTKAAGLVPVPNDPNVTKVPGLASGGGGLYSTARDYARFAQMLANDGTLNGVRILAPSTVALMRANHLPDALMNDRFGIGFQRMRPGFGFGYDVAVFEDPHKVGSTTGKGTYLWDGAAGTWFWIDPTNDIVFIGMIQRMVTGGGMPNVQNLSRALVHQALIDP
jgi:CubicO group peptidase (beta-lactamase class C family)